MAAHFDFGGLSIERFYHFVCKADRPTFELLDELGIGDRMRWRPTSMGYFIDGKLHPWGDPSSLLRLPDLDPDREAPLRRADVPLDAARPTGTRSSTSPPRDWITRWCGDEGLREAVAARCSSSSSTNMPTTSRPPGSGRASSASARSRRSLLQEELGYIEGGSETLVKALSGH